ncbi:MAG: hypothetical protein SGCHY_001710 [Lobulomycetales sp.]
MSAPSSPAPPSPSFRRAIDQILSSFDSISEWQDIIAFLSRLQKTISTHATGQLRDIPKKLIISKRLAQCLNPALPAGIHQKTLDVYHLIFSTIGPAGMSKDLGIYSFGLFPFLQHAQMSLKPMLLTIYADFYAKLDRRVLRPPLFGLILALLPGLDEEGNEFFDRVLGILDSLSRQVGQGYFFECIWLVLVKVSHLRNAALAYLLKRMPKFTSGEEIAVVLGDETGLLASALCATLGDKQVLVQRNCLELLLVVFERIHLEAIVKAMLEVVLRKDMSLNRRLYAWLNSSRGLSSDPEVQDVLVCAAKSLFTNQHTISATLDTIPEISRPYKILISLLDRAEVGNMILDHAFIDILQSLQDRVSVTTDPDLRAEIVQNGNMFMEMVDPFVVGCHFFRLFHDREGPVDVNSMKLVLFFVQECSSDDEETR